MITAPIAAPITALGNAPTLINQLAANSTAVQRDLAAALQQQSTGRVSDSYAGLDTAVRTSVDLRPAMAHAQVWQANIDAAGARLDLTQTVMKQIGAVAQEFYAQTNNINDLNAADVPNIAAQAKVALAQVAQLLNTKQGDVYVFAGQDSHNPPLPDTDAGTVGAALLASDTATPPFSATLGAGVPRVEVGDGQFVSAGLVANANTLAVSGAPSTGSYMRDLMRGLATLAAMTPATATLVLGADTRARLGSAISAMATETGTLGTVQADLEARKATLGAVQTTLAKQVSNVEDADMAQVATRVASLQTQLQASYQVIAGVKSLTLANFL